MSKSIDNRVVEMVFDNAAFEKGVSKTIESLGQLDRSIEAVGQEASRGSIFDRLGLDSGLSGRLRAIAEGIGGVFGTITEKFGLISKIAGGVAALGSGGLIGMALTGGKNRALNIEQAKFQLQGLGIAWEQVSDSINEAVDGTRYGLDSAAKAASQLAASNVALGDDMTHALRAISGVASMTNSEYDDIAQIFTRVAGQGKVMANDLNSIAARGLNAAAELAKALGTTEAEVRDMVSKGKIDFMTFSNAMNDAFGDQAKKANATFTGAMANARAALNRIGAEFYVTTEMAIDGQEKVAVGGLELGRRIFAALIPVLNSIKATMAPMVQAWREWTYYAANAAEMVLLRIEKLFWYIEPNTKNKALTSFGRGIGTIFEKLGKIVTSLIEPFRRFKDALKSLRPFSGEFRKDMSSIYEFIRPIRLKFTEFLDVFELGEGAIRLFTAAIQALVNFVAPSLNLFFDNAGKSAAGAVDWILAIKNGLDGLLGQAAVVIEAILPKMTEFGEAFSKLPKTIGDGIAKHGKRIVNFFLSIKNAIEELLAENGITDLASWLGDKLFSGLSTIQTYTQPILDFLEGMKNRLGELASEFGGGILSSVWDSVSGIQLPGLDLFGGSDSGAEGAEQLKQSVGDLGEALRRSPISRLLGSIKDSVGSFVSKLDEGPAHLSDWRSMFSQIGSSISEFVKEAIPLDGAKDTISEFFAAMSSFGSDSFAGIGSIVSNNENVAAFLNNISKSASNMFGAFKRGLPTSGQLRESLDKIASKASEVVEKLKPVAKSFGEAFGAAIQNGGKIIQSIVDKMSGLDISFDPFFNLLTSIGDSLKNFFESLNTEDFSVEGLIQFFKDLGDAIGGFVSDIAPKIGGVAKEIGGFFDAMGGLDAFGAIISTLKDLLDGLNPTLETTATSVETVSQAVEKPAGTLSKSLAGLSKAIKGTGDSIQSVEDVFNNGESDIGEKLSELSDGVNTGIENILPAVVAAAASYRLFTFTKSFQGFLDNVAGLSKKAKHMFESIGGYFDTLAKGAEGRASKLGLIRDIALALVGLALSLYLLTTVDSGALWQAVGAMAVMALVVGGLAVGLSVLTAKMKGLNALALQQMGIGLLAIAGSLAILAISIKLLAGIKLEEIGPGLLAIGGALVVLLLAARFMKDSAANMAKFGIGLFFMAGAILVLGAAAKLLAAEPLGDLAYGFGLLAIQLLALSLIGRVLGEGGRNMLQFAAGLLIMAGTLLAFLQVIKIYNEVKWDELGNGFYGLVGVVGVMAVLAVVLSFAQKGMLMGAIGIMAMAGAMLVLVAAVLVLNQAFSKANNMEQAIEALESLIIVFGLVIAVMMAFSAVEGGKTVMAIGAILAMSVAVITLTAALTVLCALPTDKLITAAVAIGALMAVLVLLGAVASIHAVAAGLIVLAGAALVISLAVVVAAVGVGMFATALALLGTIAPGVANGVATAMQIIGDAMRANGTEVAVATALMVVGILAIAFAINLAANGILKFALALVLVIGVITLAAIAISSMVQGLGEADFSAVGGKIVGSIFEGIRTAVTNALGFIGGIATSIMDTITSAIDGNTEQVHESAENLKNSVTEPVAETVPETENAMAGLEGAFSSFLGDGGSIPELMSGSMSDMLEQFGVGMEDFRSMAESGAIDTTALFGEGFDISSVSDEQLGELLNNTGVSLDAFPAMFGEAGAAASENYSANFNVSETSAEEMQKAANGIASVNFMGPAEKKGQEARDGLRKGFSGTREIGTKGAQEAVGGVRSVDTKGPGRSAGAGIVSGMLEGLNSLAQAVYARAAEIARTAALKAKSGAEVNSPSKLTIPVGEAIGEGLIVGMNNIESAVNKTGEHLGRSSALAVQFASQMMDAIDWDAEPVIRPVLDTSGLQDGMRVMDQMFLQQRMLNSVGYTARPYEAASVSSSVSNDRYYFSLNYNAGDDPNELLIAIGNSIRQANLSKG